MDLEGAIGHACSAPGASCGEVCCGSIVCRAGVWQRGPEVGCACEPESFFACGGGTCTVDRACTGYCGPDDGLEHRCDPLPPGCTSCDCVAIPPHMTCEERDGHLFFRELGFCG